MLIFSLPDHFIQVLKRSTPGVRISHSHPCSGFPLDTVLSVRPNHSQGRTFQHIPKQEEQFTILTDFHKTGSHLMYQYIWFCRRSAIYDIPNHSKGIQCLCSLNIVSPKSSQVFVEYGEISSLFKRD